ncbi:uncharacterized protein LOC111707732 [Eurytemora carolleeae]|uniref:uncharacterized protein LOC111707732 n=1 Tax=Eurytemora carolleeae TaxID=1294199 RepID=UPI000C770D57|nr:uncharacterized protein LOC111707732 [Eurytemora carolleeae]|eukprot:XP_023336639.1 uncharacterized protein LOC111707732 [Eurytemora affinis]
MFGFHYTSLPHINTSDGFSHILECSLLALPLQSLDMDELYKDVGSFNLEERVYLHQEKEEKEEEEEGEERKEGEEENWSVLANSSLRSTSIQWFGEEDFEDTNSIFSIFPGILEPVPDRMVS